MFRPQFFFYIGICIFYSLMARRKNQKNQVVFVTLEKFTIPTVHSVKMLFDHTHG